MQIEIILNDGLGESILLPPELALDGYTVKKDIPGAIIPGKPGRRTFRHLQRLEPAILRASGTIECFDKKEADDLAALLRSKLIRDEVLWLKRYDGANKFIRVQCTNVEHDPHRGHFGARLFTLTITFQADDPFWYSTDLIRVDHTAVFTPPVTFLEIENKGGELAEPVIWIEGITSGGLNTKNPRLTNYTTGQRVSFIGELKQGELLILHTAKRHATFVGSKILHSGTVVSATVDTIQLQLSASGDVDAYVGKVVRISSGAGVGQYRRIIGYNHNSKVVVIEPQWEVIPLGSQYEIQESDWADGYFLWEAQYAGNRRGVGVLDKINDDYLVDGFVLAPGRNMIELECDNELLHLKFMYRERWS